LLLLDQSWKVGISSWKKIAQSLDERSC